MKYGTTANNPFPVFDRGIPAEAKRRIAGLPKEKGKDINSTLWSSCLLADDPQSIEDVHLAFLEAGADVILTGTYQSWLEGFESLGHDTTTSKTLMLSSVDLANNARRRFLASHPSSSPRLIGLALGSYGATIAFQGAEYTGNFPASADEAFLVQFHLRRLELFEETKDEVDFVAFETVPLGMEVRAIREAVGKSWASGKPFWVGLTAPEGRWPGGELSGKGEDFWGGEAPVPVA
ncbi:Homocysteine S-methyltransferase [Pseudohyphozyma bogoriensis]|nr:Homocysteine S-methyltransferase [Pseudohyphozyma bogoriensis]